MGNFDTIVRLIVAAIIVVLFATNIITGIFGIILLVLAGVFLLTGLIHVCPLYMPFKIRTNKKSD